MIGGSDSPDAGCQSMVSYSAGKKTVCIFFNFHAAETFEEVDVGRGESGMRARGGIVPTECYRP